MYKFWLWKKSWKYFHYLDIWNFHALFITFMVVIGNMILHIFVEPFIYMEDLLLLHEDKIDFLKALESPKLKKCQNWPKRLLGDVLRCLESKFDKKISMKSVPNCQFKILTRHAITLKPPKNGVRTLILIRPMIKVHEVNNRKIPTFKAPRP